MFLKRYFLHAAALMLSVSICTAGYASDFSGTWSSSFGELRLHQTDRVIIGDYADLGVLFGEVQGDSCASGVFTNAGRSGEFSFRIVGEGEILGRYRWTGGGGSQPWNASRVTAGVPSEFKNFTRSGGSTLHINNDNQTFSGTYGSSHGELRLRDSDLFLYGDYADVGIIAARWNGLKYEGIFTNRTLNGNQVGWLAWDADVLARNLSGGSWAIIEGGGGQWPISDFQPGSAEFQNVSIDGACAPMWPF